MRTSSYIRKESLNDQTIKVNKASSSAVKLPMATMRHSRNLSDSFLSYKSDSPSPTTNFKLPNSFYNDRSKIYEKKSRVLSQRSTSFQSKPISFSQRKRFDSELTESIIRKHSQIKNMQSTQNLTSHSQSQGREASKIIKQRYQDVMRNKYKKLVLGQEIIKINKNMLERTVKRNLSEKAGHKWKSPFLKGNSIRQQFEGQSILPKRVEKVYGNEDSSQLKVLNLDRLFRVKNGKLANVVPLPIAKFSEVLTRDNIMKTIKSKDRIHLIITQYNSLLKLMQLKKTNRLSVKGKNFTKNPTLEQLMGIKLNPLKHQLYSQNQLLDQDIFINHCQYYVKHLKKNTHLTRRLISGLIQEQPHKNMSLNSFTRFYLIFVTKIACLQDKISFLIYFFIAQGQQKIQFPTLKLILELMCEELPEIGQLNVQTDLISREQKSKIFLQALNRVLFSHLQGQVALKAGLSRGMLKLILESNPDASDLMIRLLQKE